MGEGKVCWDFPRIGTGNVSGSNDAAITMFKGSGVDGLARETCQNSLDVRDNDVPDDTPVKVKFKLFYLERKSFSMFQELGEIVENARTFWAHNSLGDKKTINFLDMVSKYLAMDKIPVLMVSDYNTIGLNGVDHDQNTKSYWDLLVNTDWVSGKPSGNSAGSFGIGKRAPFVYSGLRTVFYNTLAKDGGRGFEGVAHLVTTLKEHKGKMQRTNPSGKYLYLEDEDMGGAIRPEHDCPLAKIPEFDRKKQGTDVAIFGFKLEDYEHWEEEVAVSIIKNFILALRDGKLEVEIESDRQSYDISKSTIESYLQETFQSNSKLNDARMIYKTLQETEPQKLTIAEKDDLSVYVMYDEAYPGALSRFRSTGMLINTRPRESLPHYSVVVVVNDAEESTLSKTLLASEPPKHNEWKSTNIEDDNDLRKLARKYITRINSEVRKILDACERVDVQDQMDAGIGNYLPDASEEASGTGADGLRKDVKIREISSNGQIIYRRQQESAAPSEGDEQKSNAFRTGKKKKRKIRKKKKITVVKPSDGGTKGVAPGAGKLRMVSLNLSKHRIFYVSGDTYRMVVQVPKDYDRVYVRFSAGRDDGKQDAVMVRSLREADGSLAAVQDGKAGPFPLKKGGNRLEIEFEGHEIMAVVPAFTMEVVTDEKPEDGVSASRSE